MKKLIVYFKLLRAKQWAKNGFIFTPLIFSGMLYNSQDMIRVILTFGIFCILSSSVYIINDIRDLAADKLHPKKRNRPLAAGLIKKREAAFISIALLLISFTCGYYMSKKLLFVMLLYLILHILYNFILKKEVILDVISIALGFEIRVWAGSVVINILPSVWLQLCIFLLSLFLGFIKRRHEKLTLYDKAVEHRGVLIHYTPYFLDQMIMISASLSIIFYGLYVVSSDVVKRIGNNYMPYTVPFVVYGIFRYLYLVHVRKLGGEPEEVLLSDFPFVLNMIFWIFSIILIRYYLI